MSHITVSAEKIIKCCENFLDHSAEKRKERLEEIINNYANIRLWNFRKMGYEMAYDRLIKGEAGMDYQIPFDIKLNYVSNKEQAAYNLLKLAKHGDPVIISDEHAFILDWIGE